MSINDLEQDIIRLARKHGISKKEVKNIWNYQFKKSIKLMQENLEQEITIKLRGLGSFQFSKYKLKRIREKQYEREICNTEKASENGHGAGTN